MEKADGILGWIKRSVASMLSEAILTLQLALVRPCLMSCFQFWANEYKRHMDKLENIQQKEMMKGLKDELHEEGLRNLEKPGEEMSQGGTYKCM